MQLETLNIAALVAAAVAVIAREQTKWIQGVAIAQLVAGLLLALLAGDYLNLPLDHAQLVLALGVTAGWIVVLVLGGSKNAVIAAAIGAWVAGTMTLLDLGWVKVDVLRRFFN